MTEFMNIISGIGDMPADEGIGSVFVAAGLGLLALALMYAVLLVMNYLHDKKEKEKNGTENKEDSDKQDKTDDTTDTNKEKQDNEVEK